MNIEKNKMELFFNNWVWGTTRTQFAFSAILAGCLLLITTILIVQYGAKPATESATWARFTFLAASPIIIIIGALVHPKLSRFRKN